MEWRNHHQFVILITTVHTIPISKKAEQSRATSTVLPSFFFSLFIIATTNLSIVDACARNSGARSVITRRRSAAASHVHEAQPGGPRLEVPAAAALALALALPVAVGRGRRRARADDPLQQQRAHGPAALVGRPAPPGLAAAAARRGRPVPVAAAAERPRVVRRRAEARQLLAAAGDGGGPRTSANGRGGGGEGRRAACRGHVRQCCAVLCWGWGGTTRGEPASGGVRLVGGARGGCCFYTRDARPGDATSDRGTVRSFNHVATFLLAR
jgi:hypothetical protein